MDRTRRERVGRLLQVIADQMPRAYAAHPRGVPLHEAAADADWWRGPHRFILPRADALDHWEATYVGDPVVYVELLPKAAFLGLQVEGPVGIDRVGRLLVREHASRLEAFLAAAARQADEAVSAALRIHLEKDGRWSEAVIDRREAPTMALGPALLEGLLDAAGRLLEGATTGAPHTAGVRLLRVPVDEADPVALRREAKRLVTLWRPVWGLPVPRPRLKKPDLDARLADAYRRSLRFIAGSMGPAERGRLRVEVRALMEAYREANLQRPRLLDVVSERLGLL